MEVPDKILKTADKKTYMREYKRNQYQDPEKGHIIKERNKSYYLKKKHNLDNDEIKLFGILFPLVFKIRKEMEELKKSNPLIAEQILAEFLAK